MFPNLELLRSFTMLSKSKFYILFYTKLKKNCFHYLFGKLHQTANFINQVQPNREKVVQTS